MRSGGVCLCSQPERGAQDQPSVRDGHHGTPWHGGHGGWRPAPQGHQGDPRASTWRAASAGTPHWATTGRTQGRASHCHHQHPSFLFITHCTGVCLKALGRLGHPPVSCFTITKAVIDSFHCSSRQLSTFWLRPWVLREGRHCQGQQRIRQCYEIAKLAGIDWIRLMQDIGDHLEQNNRAGGDNEITHIGRSTMLL